MNAVVITFDCLPSHRLGCYGALSARTPHCDRLASESAVFMRHFAAWTGEPYRGEPWWSVDPVAAMRARGFEDRHRTADAAATNGLQFRGLALSSWIEWRESLPRPWQRKIETFDVLHGAERRAPDGETLWQHLATDAAAALRELRRDVRHPWLFWVQASGLDESEMARDWRRAVAQWDDGLGRLLAAVNEEKPNEKTLLIVVGGRGALASPRSDVPTAYIPLLSEIAQVPLFVRLPSSRDGCRIQEPVTTSELWPSLFGWFGCDPDRPSEPPKPENRGWLATIHGEGANREAAANREIVTVAGRAAALRGADRVTWAMIADAVSGDTAARGSEAGGPAQVDLGHDAPAPQAFLKPEDLWETLDRAASIPEACEGDVQRLRSLVESRES